MGVIGQRVGPFEILEPVWVPESGRWYVGRADSGDDALIRLAGPTEADRGAVAQQRQVLVRLHDPRIPSVVAHDERLGAIALAAGVGTPLTEAIAQRIDESIVLTPATLVDVLLEIALALQHAHDKGIVHGHLDPDHIVLGSDGRVWVFGFGANGPMPPAWTPPERTRGDAPTRATDVWCTCALGLGLVLGHPPFRTADQASRGDCSAPVALVSEQWPALGRTLGRGLGADPAERYPSADGLVSALGELKGVAGPDTERASLGATLWARRALMYRSMVGSAPTAVPLDGIDERADPTDPVGWFGPTPLAESLTDPRASALPPPRLAAEFTSVVPRQMLQPEDATLGEDRPPTRVPTPPIQRFAPVLAGAMVVLLIVWLLTAVL